MVMQMQMSMSHSLISMSEHKMLGDTKNNCGMYVINQGNFMVVFCKMFYLNTIFVSKTYEIVQHL